MTCERALDHVHRVTGNDLIDLRINFKPCLESWENALGAQDEYDDDQKSDELDMEVVEEDEPLPLEEDISL